VDVVIGALPPTLSRANLDVLAHGGHFVDLGKLGGLDDAGIKALRPDIQHSVMSLDIDAISDPVWVGKTLRSIKSELSNGALAYLPVKEFPVSDADKAFRYLAKTQHIGKVVLRFP